MEASSFSSYLVAQVGGWKIACELPAVWKEHLKDLRHVIGDQNLPGVLTFFRGKPDHPRKVKSYCRPEVGGRESGPGNVTDLLHREARLLWQQGSMRRKSFCKSVADGWCVWSG